MGAPLLLSRSLSTSTLTTHTPFPLPPPTSPSPHSRSSGGYKITQACGGGTESKGWETAKPCDVALVPVSTDGGVKALQKATPADLVVEVRSFSDPLVQASVLTGGTNLLPPTKSEDEAAGAASTALGGGLVGVGIGLPLLCVVCAFFAAKR